MLAKKDQVSFADPHTFARSSAWVSRTDLLTGTPVDDCRDVGLACDPIHDAATAKEPSEQAGRRRRQSDEVGAPRLGLDENLPCGVAKSHDTLHRNTLEVRFEPFQVLQPFAL